MKKEVVLAIVTCDFDGRTVEVNAEEYNIWELADIKMAEKYSMTVEEIERNNSIDEDEFDEMRNNIEKDILINAGVTHVKCEEIQSRIMTVKKYLSEY